MSVTQPRAWTQDAFFSWVESQEQRYEFDGFEPLAMMGGTPLHAVLITRLVVALQRRLEGGRCQAIGPDVGLATVGEAVRYPDAVITCGAVDLGKRTIDGVVIVFEVLSPSSGRIDRIVKVREYADVPSIRRYVMIEFTGVGLTVLSRAGPEEGWMATALAHGDVLCLPEVGIEVPVSEIYAGVTLLAEA